MRAKSHRTPAGRRDHGAAITRSSQRKAQVPEQAEDRAEDRAGAGKTVTIPRVTRAGAVALGAGIGLFLAADADGYSPQIPYLAAAFTSAAIFLSTLAWWWLQPRVGALTTWVALGTAWSIIVPALAAATGACAAGSGDGSCDASQIAAWSVTGVGIAAVGAAVMAGVWVIRGYLRGSRWLLVKLLRPRPNNDARATADPRQGPTSGTRTGSSARTRPGGRR